MKATKELQPCFDFQKQVPMTYFDKLNKLWESAIQSELIGSIYTLATSEH